MYEQEENNRRRRHNRRWSDREPANWYGYGRDPGDHLTNESRQSDPGVWKKMKNFFGIGPKGYKRSDERIREDVCEALALHPEVDASNIEVFVEDGHVTLRGSVDNRWMKRRAEDALMIVSGVQDVKVDLSISPGTETTERY